MYILRVFDTSFVAVTTIDTYKSLIWTERYREAGDFELVADASALSYIRKGYYLFNETLEKSRSMKHLMIVENFELKTDVEFGNYIVISGRGVESIFDRRIIWKQTILNGAINSQMRKLLTQNVTNPSDANRKINDVLFNGNTTDYRVINLPLRAQYTGDNLYDTICAICSEKDIGWNLRLNSSNKFVFYLYKGIDRSMSQGQDHDIDHSVYTEVPYISSVNPAFINTGFSSKSTYTVEIDAENLRNGISLFGFRVSSGDNTAKFHLLASSTTQNITVAYGSAYYNTGIANDEGRHMWRMTPEGFYYDNELIWSHTPIEFTSTDKNLFLFGVNQNGTPAGRGSGTKIYSFKLWDGDTLVAHYIPVKRVSDNKVGFYDLVQQNFRVNAADTGSFTCEEYSEIPYVMFSPDFDNIISSNYIESDKPLKNVALIAGEGEGTERKTFSIGSSTGLDRRELFVDARDISSTTDSETTMSTDEYNALLKQRGYEKLAECQSVNSFEGQIDVRRTFVYDRDYSLGDTCEMKNEYGIGQKIQITEVVISSDENGDSVYPTFCSI